MRNLLYKEFHLTIHPLYYLVALFGALLLIPEWLYFLALMYFFFITVPNIFTNGKAQNDIEFSVMLPVRRRDTVKARIVSMVLLELIQITVTAIFVVINILIYPNGNFLLDANIAFIGFTFIIFGLYNIIFFPMFYKTAYKIALPVITAMTAVILFAAGVEMLVMLVPAAKVLDGTKDMTIQLPLLFGGIVLFALLSFAAFKISAKRFERIDI